MRTQIQKRSGAASISIPEQVMLATGLCIDEFVYIRIDGSRLIIEAVGRPVFDLDQLLGQITPDNLHDEVSIGPLVGAEVW